MKIDCFKWIVGLLNKLRTRLSSRSLSFYNENFYKDSKINSVLIPLETATVAVNFPMARSGRSCLRVLALCHTQQKLASTGIFRTLLSVGWYTLSTSSQPYYLGIEIKDSLFRAAEYFQPESTSVGSSLFNLVKNIINPPPTIVIP